MEDMSNCVVSVSYHGWIRVRILMCLCVEDMSNCVVSVSYHGGISHDINVSVWKTCLTVLFQ